MIKIIQYTKEPLLLIGDVASICWDSKSNKNIAIDCINSKHDRVLEYADIIISIENYSARMIRELYTHIQGVSRLQSSTRYIDYGNFEYYIPESIKNNTQATQHYITTMAMIGQCYEELEKENIPKEDIANILPLGMMSKMVLKINLRAILHLFEVRTCNRVYKEFRNFMQELKVILINLDNDWKYIIENHAKTKCEKLGVCEEKNGCGQYPKKELKFDNK